MTVPHHTWSESPVPLRFLLGEYCLGTMRIPALVRREHFTQLSRGVPDPAPLLADLRPGLEAVVLSSQPVDSKLPRLSWRGPAICYVPVQVPRYFVEIQGDFQTYLKKFSAKPRHNLMRSVKKFREASGGSDAFKEYRTPDEAAAFHEFASQVSQRTYQTTLLNAGVPDTAAQRATFVAQAQENKFRGFLLLQHGIPVAFAHCSVSPLGLTYEKIGYDPAYAKWSPGTVLLFLILEQLFEEGGPPRVFDFGTGEAHYKSFFSTGSITCADIFFMRKTISNALWITAHATLDVVSTRTVSALHRFGIKDAVKQFLRRRATSSA